MIPVSLERLCCLDFEASALGEGSYPIEAAVVHCSTLEGRSWLIRPSPRWLSEGRWSKEAADLHHISLRELLANGTPIAQVAAELAECCRGKNVLCDGGEHDQRWLTTLFAAAGKNVPFLMGDFDSFVSKLEQDVDGCRDELSEIHYPNHHRALPDAQSLAEKLRLLVL